MCNQIVTIQASVFLAGGAIAGATAGVFLGVTKTHAEVALPDMNPRPQSCFVTFSQLKEATCVPLVPVRFGSARCVRAAGFRVGVAVRPRSRAVPPGHPAVRPVLAAEVLLYAPAQPLHGSARRVYASERCVYGSECLVYVSARVVYHVNDRHRGVNAAYRGNHAPSRAVKTRCRGVHRVGRSANSLGRGDPRLGRSHDWSKRASPHFLSVNSTLKLGENHHVQHV